MSNGLTLETMTIAAKEENESQLVDLVILYNRWLHHL